MPRGRGRRLFSETWSRLKPAPDQNPLEVVGYISKGDKTLLDFDAQEKYYKQIVRKWLVFCDAGERDELRRRFDALRMSFPEADPDDPNATEPLMPRTAEQKAIDKTNGLVDILMALRKLREGIVATKRCDFFAACAYHFNIRVAVLSQHHESYHPAILHLLRFIGVWELLNSSEVEEVAIYLALDLACRRRELAAAYEIRNKWKIQCPRLRVTLRAMATDNYRVLQKVKLEVDRYQLKIIQFYDDFLRVHMLKCFGRAYLSVDLEFLEKTTEKKWEELQKEDSVGWTLEDGQVTIRKIKPKPKGKEPETASGPAQANAA